MGDATGAEVVNFDTRTEDNLATLLPAVVPTFRRALVAMQTYLSLHGYTVRAIDGSRTYAEQDRLYAKGRTAPGPKVTNARGGESHHSFGIAIDIGLFKDGQYVPESPLYAKLGPIGELNGLAWGGRWKSPVDMPHYEFPTGLSLAQLRARVSNNTPIVHVPTEPEDKPLVWTVVYEGKQIIDNCKDTASVRAVAEALKKTIVVDNKNKVITIK